MATLKLSLTELVRLVYSQMSCSIVGPINSFWNSGLMWAMIPRTFNYNNNKQVYLQLDRVGFTVHTSKIIIEAIVCNPLNGNSSVCVMCLKYGIILLIIITISLCEILLSYNYFKHITHTHTLAHLKTNSIVPHNTVSEVLLKQTAYLVTIVRYSIYYFR